MVWSDYPCIEFEGYIDPYGYGQVGTTKYGTRVAHVVEWIKVHGSRPKGLELDHLCDNRSCIQIEHLEAVSAAENSRRKKSNKLTMEDARKIRKMYAGGEYLQRELAERYSVTRKNIGHVIANETWRE